MKKTKIYLVGSLRNPAIRPLAQQLRALDFDVFDDWHSGGPEADDIWQTYERDRGRSYKQALNGAFANNNFAFDKAHIDASDIVVLLMPAGKSGHLELGYAAGIGKETYIVFDQEPERFDLMYKFATDIFFSVDELLKRLMPPKIVFDPERIEDEIENFIRSPRNGLYGITGLPA